jgi:carbonic anhydrase/acetyltransferase-like protein (isoleucine patch superfamily)
MSYADPRHPGAIIRPFRNVMPRIADDAFIAPGVVLVGDVTVESGASVWYGCVLRGDDNTIHIGPRANIQDGTVIHVTLHDFPTLIGADVIIGHGARLHGCTLEDNCLVGIGTVVLDGVVVERQAMVAAGAVVTPKKRVPTGQLWAGNPARYMRDLRPEDTEFLEWDAAHYARLAHEYRTVVEAGS